MNLLSAEEVAADLIKRIDKLPSAKIVFMGFSLPEEFGESASLQFGDLDQLASIGLGANSVEMGRSFVKKTIEELFLGEFGPFVPEGTRFVITQEETENVLTISAHSESS